MSSQKAKPLRSEVAQALGRDSIRYSSVWEDHRLVTEGLQIGPGDDVLSIASAGTNVLAILLQEPNSVTAIDVNAAQNHLVELKLAGIRHLDYETFISLMGFGDADPMEGYRRVRAHLSQSARQFWDERGDDIRDGIYRCGRLDRYLRVFRDEYLPDLWRPGLIEELFDAPDLETQAALFEEEAFTPAFQQRFKWYYGRQKMAEDGRDPAQFRYVDIHDVGGYFLQRFHDVCTRLRLAGNFYVERFLTGSYRDLEQGPLYLRRRNFEKLRDLVDRVELVTSEIETHLTSIAPGTYSKANLSDIFEYMSTEASDRLFELFARAMRSGGRIAYWNLLVERHPSKNLDDRLDSLAEQAQGLWLKDRAWFYRSFELIEVCDP